MGENTCKSCAYFRQHYTFDKRHIFRVHCGHCIFQKVKTKRPESIACGNYVLAPQDEDAFVSKEYLSKELLQYVLKLELLPEIKEGE